MEALRENGRREKGGSKKKQKRRTLSDVKYDNHRLFSTLNATVGLRSPVGHRISWVMFSRHETEEKGEVHSELIQ